MPPQASSFAGQVDTIFWSLVGVSVAIMALVGALVLLFAFRYRRGTQVKRGAVPERVSREVEIGWTVATLFAFVFVFWFAAAAQTTQFEIPKNATEIHVVAKQWMWKIEHEDGNREIDALHVPIGVPVRLVMTSQDVIHSFFVPAFRIKQDVLPGRITEAWFEPTKVGTYHLFCTEYCGTDHSRMGGFVTVMTPGDYAKWSAAQPQGDSLADQGARIFVRAGCAGCHAGSDRVRAPSLAGLAGRAVPLEGGGFATADEAYLRDSILLPQKQVVAGYAPVMPSYEGVLSEDEVIRLVAYLQSGKVTQQRQEVSSSPSPSGEGLGWGRAAGGSLGETSPTPDGEGRKK